MNENIDSTSYKSSGFDDAAILIACSQIAADYQKFTKFRILPRLKKLAGLSLRDLQVLITIKQRSGVISPSDIATELRLDPSTISRAVQALLNRNMILQEDNDLDSRSVILHIEAKGDELVAEYQEYFRAAIRAMEDKYDLNLNQAERDLILKVLFRLRERSKVFGKVSQSRVKLYF